MSIPVKIFIEKINISTRMRIGAKVFVTFNTEAERILYRVEKRRNQLILKLCDDKCKEKELSLR